MPSKPIPNRKGRETRRKILDAVGQLIQSDGLDGLTMTGVAATSGVSVRNVHHHFPRRSDLLLTYLSQEDFWLSILPDVEKLKALHKENYYREFSAIVFKRLVTQLYNNRAFRDIILMELRGDGKWLIEIFRQRDAFGEKLLTTTDEYFKHTDVDFRMIVSWLIYGMEKVIARAFELHQWSCGVDFLHEHILQRTFQCIESLMRLLYREGGRADGD